MITRFSVIKDDRRLLLGIDKLNLFEEGIVYEAFKILDEIIIKPVGKYALPAQGPNFPNEMSEANYIIESGCHLITKQEKSQL